MGSVSDSDLLEHAAVRHHGAAEEWPMQSVRRAGSPPLRFHGRQLLGVGAAGDDRPRPFLRLWQRKAGGFVIEYADWRDEGPDGNAVRLETLDDVMSHLEEICAELDASARAGESGGTAKGANLFQTVLHRSRRADWVREFLSVAGEGLDAIDRLAAAGPGQTHGGSQ